jgi:hypothetical protein
MLTETENRLAAWDVLSKSDEELLEWARTEIPRRIVEIFDGGDQPLQLVVHERLFDVVTQALTQPILPDASVLPNMDQEEAVKNFTEFCAKFPVRSASTEQLAVPLEVQVAPEQQFCVFLTLQGQQINYLRAFDQKLGISQYLHENNVPLALDQKDMLDMVKTFILLQCINRISQQQVVAAKTGDLQNLSGQIYRP